jgi:transcriptional regulator with XRE-family HTH domain
MAKNFTYKSYNFVDKDPIIDEIRTIVQDSGSTYKQIHDDSGVSAATLSNWFAGETRRPQAASINAVLRCLGYKLGIVPYEVVSMAKQPPAAASGTSVSHVVRMAKIRRRG